MRKEIMPLTPKLLPALVSALLLNPLYAANSSTVGLWLEATTELLGETAEWSNKVELADINGDGLVDILFANGGNYNEPGEPESSRIFLNQGAGQPFKEATQDIFAHATYLTRAIKARDLNGDGHVDLFLATTYQTQSQLYLGDGKGNFTLATEYLPQYFGSFGDVDIGDVDGDGDLDIVLADWGAGDPMENEGAQVRLWLNDGTGRFTDATATLMPETKVRFSWELDFADIDNDSDLDVLISSKSSDGSFVFLNDGSGTFTDVTLEHMPQYSNNYDCAVMDLNQDGFIDLVTVNDGEHVNPDDPYSRRNSIFFNDGTGKFIDVTAKVLPVRDNPGVDDNLSVFLDFDSDGDADILIGSLSGPDRVLINDGHGNFHLDVNMLNTFTYEHIPSHGTLGMAVADLNGDHKLDVVESQGEVAYPERIYLGHNIAADTAPPHINNVKLYPKVLPDGTQAAQVRARIHDNKRPTMPHDWRSITLHWDDNGVSAAAPMQWYGEYLWRADLPRANVSYHICAIDAAGNQHCTSPTEG
jgi:hypothetical protein